MTRGLGCCLFFDFEFHPLRNFPYAIPILKPVLEEQKVTLYMKHRNFLIF